MSRRGDVETNQLRANIENQLNRLVTQLQDIEDMKSEMDSVEEYESSKKETLDQMREFEASLQKMAAGNISLIDEINSLQLKLQQTISNAVKSQANVSHLFDKSNSKALRGRLVTIEAEYRNKRISAAAFKAECVDILSLLEKEDKLTSREMELLKVRPEHFFV